MVSKGGTALTWDLDSLWYNCRHTHGWRVMEAREGTAFPKLPTSPASREGWGHGVTIRDPSYQGGMG